MADGIRYDLMVLLAKIEGTYGVDPTPTGAANAILGINCDIKPMEGNDVSRDLLLAYLGGQQTIPTGLNAVLSFETELAGSGAAGTAPKWGILARGAGLSETVVASTSVAYAPVSASFESIALYFWIGAVKHVLLGARGTGVISVGAEGIPRIKWTFTGLWTKPADGAAATPTLTGFTAPLVANKDNTPTFTINSVAIVLKSYELDFGNDVQKRFLIGKKEVIIAQRAEKMKLSVEAVTLATLDPFALAQNPPTLVPVTLVHGITAGNIATLTHPKTQIGRPSNYGKDQEILMWGLDAMPLPNAGNDQFAITLT